MTINVVASLQSSAQSETGFRIVNYNDWDCHHTPVDFSAPSFLPPIYDCHFLLCKFEANSTLDLKVVIVEPLRIGYSATSKL